MALLYTVAGLRAETGAATITPPPAANDPAAFQLDQGLFAPLDLACNFVSFPRPWLLFPPPASPAFANDSEEEQIPVPAQSVPSSTDAGEPLNFPPIVNAAPGSIVVADGQQQNITTLVDIQGTASSDHRVTYSQTNANAYRVPFVVQGAQGSLRAQGGILLGPNTQISVLDSTPYTGVAGGRIGDDTPVQLTSAIFSYPNTISPARDLSETIGALRVGGYASVSYVSLASPGTGSTSILADRLDRIGLGTLEILTMGALGNAGTGAGYLRLNTAPATTDGGVVPYVAALASTGNYGLVVYESAAGLRLLTAGEYTTSIAAVTPASHLKIPANTTLTNNNALTVRSITLGNATGTLTGSGTLSVLSGLVFAPSAGGRVDNTIDFGNQEALIAAEGSGVSAEFSKPVLGSGGLTIYGTGAVAFTGGNQITGPLVLNGRVNIVYNSPANLGPDSSEIQVNGRDYGAGLQLGTSSLELTRPVRVNSGYFAVSTSTSGTVLTLNGAISGPGGLFIRGNTFLGGTNTYTGATVVESNLSFLSDAAFGTTSSIVMAAGGTIKLIADWTTARSLQSSELSNSLLNLDTNGFDLDFQGTLGGTGTPYIAKQGGGHFYISKPADAVSSAFRVSGGEIALRADGRVKTSAIEVDQGGLFTVDNRTQVATRGTLNLNLVGGEFRILGHSSLPTTIAGNLDATGTSFSNSTSSVLTLSAPGSAPVTFNATTLSYDPDYDLLIRGDNLAGPSGTVYTRLHVTNRPALKGGIYPQIVADSNSAGFGSAFATYDTTSDGAGVVGLRPLKASEMVATPQIANPANGGGTALAANFLVTGDVSTVGAANTLNSLTLDPGSHLSIAGSSALTLTQNTLLVRSGAVAEISGGKIGAASSTLTMLGGGDLRLAAPVISQSVFRHYGPGVLEITQAQPISTFRIVGGSVQAGPGDPMANVRLDLDRSARFNVLAGATQITQLTGTGVVNLDGRLTIQYLEPGSTSTFSGSLTGAGTLVVATSLSLTGDSPFAGTILSRSALSLSGTLPNLSGLTLDGSLKLDYATAKTTAPRIPSSLPIVSDSGSIGLTTYPVADTVALLGPLSAGGITQLYIDNSSSLFAPKSGTLAFADLQRSDRGALIFSTNLSIGRTGRFDFTHDISSQLIGNTAVPTARPILPFALMNNRPVTFEPGVGIRILAPAEQATTIVDGQNVNLASSMTFNGVITLNSLEVPGGSSLTGTGLIHLTSGFAIVGGPISPSLDFGSAEGEIFTVDSATNSQVSGKISGSNGLTISGFRTLALFGQNTFTGPLTINGSTVQFASMANLGADSSPITLTQGTLQPTLSSFTFSRGLDLHGGYSTFGGGMDQPITLAGPVSGSGGLRLSGTILLANPANSYSGVTMFDGTLKFASDSALGSSPVLEATPGPTPSTLQLLAPWTTARKLSLASTNLTIDTAGFSAVLNGALDGTYQFTKAGAGTVTVNSAGTYTGRIFVSVGTLRLNTNLTDSTKEVSVDGRLEGQATLIRPLTLAGTLAPGVGLGTIETGSVSFSGGSKLELEVGSPTAFDQFRVDGTVTFTGLTQLAILAAPDTILPAAWPILLNDGTDLITTSSTKGFAIGSTVLTEGATFLIGSQSARITYKGGDGNDVFLTIPEPGSTVLLGLLGAFCCGLRRRRRPARPQPAH